MLCSILQQSEHICPLYKTSLADQHHFLSVGMHQCHHAMRVKTSRYSWSQLAPARAAWSCVFVDTAGSVSLCQWLAISWHCVVVLKLQMKAHGNNLLDYFATQSNLSLAQTGSLRRHCGGHPSNPVCQCVEAHRAAHRRLAKQTGDPSARYSSSSSSHGYTLSRYK